MRSDREKRNKNKKKHIWRIVIGIIVFLFLLLGTGIGYYASSIGQFFNQISDGASGKSNDQIAIQNRSLEEEEPFAALILGVDLGSENQQRTDTIMLATVNPEEESVKLVSLPRDLPVTLESGFTEKINAMYQVGGTELVRDVVEDMFDIPISFHAIMDFQGLIELVDAVGGITVDSDLSFTVQDSNENSDAIKIEKGMQDLNGEEALGYARMRKQDPRGDFGRQERQQEVIQSVADELLSLNAVTNFTRILNSVAPYMSTDATSEQMLLIASNYLSAARNIESLSIEGENSRMYFPHYGHSVYVYEPYDESIEEVSTELQNHLGIEATDSQPEEPSIQESEESTEEDLYGNDPAEEPVEEYPAPEEEYEAPVEEEPAYEEPIEEYPSSEEQYEAPIEEEPTYEEPVEEYPSSEEGSEAPVESYQEPYPEQEVAPDQGASQETSEELYEAPYGESSEESQVYEESPY